MPSKLFLALKQGDVNKADELFSNGKTLEAKEVTVLLNIRLNADKKENYTSFIQKYKNKQLDDQLIIDALLADMTNKPYAYTPQAFYNLPELPFKWSQTQKDKLFAIMKRREKKFNELNVIYPKAPSPNEVSIDPLKKFIDEFPKKSTFPALAKIKKAVDSVKLGFAPPTDQYIKLFTQIHGEHITQGTTAEGISTFPFTLKFLHQYVKNKGDKLENLRKKLEVCITSKHLIDQIRFSLLSDKDSKFHEEMITELSRHFAKQMISNDSTLFPGGWVGGEDLGQAMLYQFKKISEKPLQFQFTIYNPSAGVENYHTSKETKSGLAYSPSKTYTIDSEEKLKDLVKFIVKEQIDNSPDTSNKDHARLLYQEISKYANPISMQPENLPTELVHEKRTGTSAWRAIQTFLKAEAESEGINYNETYYELIKNSITICYLTVKKYGENKGYSSDIPLKLYIQLNTAVENFSRHLLRLKENNQNFIIPPGDIELINNAKTLLDKIQQTIEAQRVKQAKGDHVEEKFDQIYEVMTYKTTTCDLASHHLTTGESPKETNILFDKTAPIKSFNELLVQCQMHLQLGHYATVAKKIEQFYLSIENPTFNTWHQQIPDKNQLSDYISTIEKISSIYTVSIARQNASIPFAEQFVVFEINKQLAEQISELFYEDQPKLKSLILERFPPTNITTITNQPCFTNLTPLNNEHLANIKHLEPSQPKKSSTKKISMQSAILNATEEIIRSNPKNLEAIIKMCHEDKEFCENVLIEEKKGDKSSNEILAHYFKQVFAESQTSNISVETPASNLTVDSELKYPCLPAAKLAALYYLLKKDTLKEKFNALENEIRKQLNPLFSSEKILINSSIYCNDKNECRLNQSTSSTFVDLDNLYDYIHKEFSNKLRVLGDAKIGYQLGFKSDDPFTLDSYIDLSSKYPHFVVDTYSLPEKSQSHQQLANDVRKESNSIQAETLKPNASLTKENALQRAILSTRSCPETQVVSTINLLKQHMIELERKDFQAHFFANLFQSNLLQEQIKVSPQTILDLIETINKALQTFKKDKINQPTLFLLKLNLCLEKFLSELPKTYGNFSEELKKLSRMQDITKKITQYESLKNPSEFERGVLKQLHGYNVMHIKNLLHQEKNPSPELMDSVLKSWLAFNSLPDGGVNDYHITYQTTRAFTDLEEKIKQHCLALKSYAPKNLDALLTQYARERNNINLRYKEHKWIGNFPNFQLINRKSEVIINTDLLTGTLVYGNQKFAPLPPKVYEDPLYKQFIKKPVSNAIASPDNSVFEFSVDNQLYRFIKSHQTTKVYRKMEVNGKQNWYEYVPKNVSLDSDSNIAYQLPKTLTEFSNEIWVSVDEKKENIAETQNILIINEQEHKVVAFFEKGEINQVKEHKSLDSSYSTTGFKLINTSTRYATRKSDDFLKNYSFLENVEDINYIEFWKKETSPPSKTGEYNIQLKRYGISFKQSVEADGKLGDLIWEQDPRYKIKLPTNDFIPRFKGLLQLTSDNKELNDIAITPKQQFYYRTSYGDDLYHTLFFDTESFIVNRTEKENTSPFSQQFTKQEQYATFNITQPLTLVPKNNEDKIYLAFLYLANHHPMEAFETLKSVTAPVSASALLQLYDIVFNIPYMEADFLKNSPDCKDSQKSRSESPHDQAVRMLAVSLLVEQKTHHPDTNKMLATAIKEKKSLDDNLNNKFSLTKLKHLNDFWQNDFTKNIVPIYQDYRKKLRKTPEDMRLDDIKEYRVAEYITQNLPDSNPLVALRKKLLLIRNLKEHQKLLKLTSEHKTEASKANHSIKQLEKRKQALEVEIKQLQTQIEGVTITKKLTIVPNNEQLSEAKDEKLSERISLKKGYSSVLKEEQTKFPTSALGKKFAVQEEEVSQQVLEAKSKANKAKNEIEAKSEYIGEEYIKLLLKYEHLDDYLAGIRKNKQQNINELAAKSFCEALNQEQKSSIFTQLNASTNIKEKTLEKIQAKIIKLANELKVSPVEAELKIFGKEKAPLTFEKILHLFLAQDRNFYRQSTALDDEGITQLNNFVYQFLLQATEQQRDKRLENEFKILLDQKASTKQKDAAVIKIGILLDKEEHYYDPAKHPEMLLFEYLDNKQLYKEQCKYIEDFLKEDKDGYQNLAIQFIMGSGKSKVLLPILALKKANGTNLSVIEVPDALFQLNKADLSAIIKEKFGHDLKSFYFNDGIECDLEFLTNTRNMLRAAIANREPVITTRQSMQAFQNNFLVFLNKPSSNPAEIQKAKLYTEILNSFKQADAMIDEADSTLDPRKQQIITAGTQKALPTDDLKSVLDLFTFLNRMTIKLPKTIKLQKIIRGTQTCTDEDWKMILENITHQLVNVSDEKKSSLPGINPLQPIIQKLSSNKSVEELEIIKCQLINYLQGKDEKPNFLSSNLLSPNEKDRLAIYKEQITNVLSLTLKKKMNESFGLPLSTKVTGMDREIAMPYVAAKTPSEGSQFKEPLEILNYTLRLQFNQPISKHVVMSFLKDFKAKSFEERLHNLQEGDDVFKKEFRTLTGYDLDAIELNDKTFDDFYDAMVSRDTISQKTGSLTSFKEYCLLNYVLKHITHNDLVVISDPHNHISQYRTAQLMTGTDWNYRCYPPHIKSNKELSHGSDGQTLNYMLTNEIPPAVLNGEARTKEEKMQKAVNLLSEHKNPDKLHAWIDLGAYFTTHTNQEVANEFSELFTKDPAYQQLEYILFFMPDKNGESSRLYALPTSNIAKNGKPQKSPTPILLEQSSEDYLDKILECTNANRFTYYDQSHIIGTDIKHPVDAIAVMPMGPDTMTHTDDQGAWRMRGLKVSPVAPSQKVQYIVPQDVQEAYPSISDWDVKTIKLIEKNNQIPRLADDHYRSALQAIKNYVHKDLMERLLSVEPEQQFQWMKQFRQVLFQEENRSAFERYGEISKKIDTGESLKSFADSIMQQWKAILGSAKIEIQPGEKDIIQALIDKAIEHYAPICNRLTDSLASKHSLNDSMVSISQQSQQQQQAQMETTNESTGVRVIPYEPRKLSTLNFSELSIESSLSSNMPGGGGIRAKHLRALVPDASKKTWQFSDNIYISENFYNTCNVQSKFIDGYTKNATYFLVEQSNNPSPHVNFLLITQEEAAHIRNQLAAYKQNGDKHIWIETAHESLLVGNKPSTEHLHTDYKKSIEQIAFFGGDTDILNKSLASNNWLKENSADKIEYLQQYILPYHKDKVNLVDKLKRTLGISHAISDPKKETALPSLTELKTGTLFGTAATPTKEARTPEPEEEFEVKKIR